MSSISEEWDTLEKMIVDNNYKGSTVRFAYGSGRDPSCFCKIEFGYKNDQENDIQHDYDKFTLIRRSLTIIETNALLTNIKNGRLELKPFVINVKDLDTKVRLDHSFIPSGMTHTLIDPDRPTHYYEIKIPNFYDVFSKEIIPKMNLPAYPTKFQAVKDFIMLNQSISRIPSMIIILLPDINTKISQLTLVGENVILEIESTAIDENNLFVKLYCRRGTEQSYPSSDISIINSTVNFKLSFEPDTVIAHLMDKRTNSVLDRKSIEYWQTEQKGTYVKTTETYVKELIRKRENNRVEFKKGIDDEFLETISSFSNTVGGTIIIGVTDNGIPVGYWEDEEKTRKKVSGMIQSYCEPLVQPSLEWTDINGKPILLVKVTEGNDKPYTIKEKGIFFRYDEHDIHIERRLLDQIYVEKFGKSPNTGLEGLT